MENLLTRKKGIELYFLIKTMKYNESAQAYYYYHNKGSDLPAD